MGKLLLLLLAAVSPFLVSCSMFMNRVGDDRPVGRQPDCDDGVLLPILDMIPAGYFGLIALAVANEHDGVGPALLSGAIAGAFGTSGVRGFRGAARCKSENREWEKELRFGPLARELRERTGMEPEKHPDRSDTLILRARDQDTCARLEWTAEVDMMRSQLEAYEVSRVECRYEGVTFWAGSLFELPETLEDTICAAPLDAYFRTGDPRQAAQRLETMPSMCRQGVGLVDWYPEAARLASLGQCSEALLLTEKIWHTSPAVHEHLLRRPEIVACFESQNPQEVTP